MEREQLYQMALVQNFADGSPSRYLHEDGSYGSYPGSLSADRSFLHDRVVWLTKRSEENDAKEQAYRNARVKVQTDSGTHFEYEQPDGSFSRRFSGSVREKLGKELNIEEPI